MFPLTQTFASAFPTHTGRVGVLHAPHHPWPVPGWKESSPTLAPISLHFSFLLEPPFPSYHTRMEEDFSFKRNGAPLRLKRSYGQIPGCIFGPEA